MKATSFASVYLENKGVSADGTLQLVTSPLSMMAQLAPLTNFSVEDVNRDGHLDVLDIGNQFTSDFMTGRYDASCGLLLLGNGRGKFRPLTPNQSDVYLSGDMKSLIKLQVNGQPRWLVGTNSAPIQTLIPSPHLRTNAKNLRN